jgi:putative DNA primase/helicase
MNPIKERFKTAMWERRGLLPPSDPIADGEIHRCATEDGKRGNTDGAYKLYIDDAPAGGFQNHCDGAGWQNWRYEGGKPICPEAAGVARRKAEIERRQREARQQQSHSKAACIARAEWERLDDEGESPYLKRKQVGAYGVRFRGNEVVIPLHDFSGNLWCLQTIRPDGFKPFCKGGKKTGHFHVIGDLEGATLAYVAEGYSTAASIYQATGKPVIVAFDAGNLDPVIETFRRRQRFLRLVSAGDDDQWKPLNTGRTKAEAAAKKHGCTALFPHFLDVGGEPTDFNDLHCLQGLEAVRKQLAI